MNKDWKTQKKYLQVFDKNIAYVESGDGQTIVLLHGNPTSSYLWRNVIPELESKGRCIAPDLVGMGDSEKLDGEGPMRYNFNAHYKYLKGFLYKLGITDDVILVLHDWGSALGFHWAEKNREAVAGIVYMEAIVRPFQDWNEFNKSASPMFQGFRSDAGEKMVLTKNLFIERVLPGSVSRELSEDEMNEYRRPFLQERDRWPMLDWPRQLPIAGEPAEIVNTVAHYANWLSSSTLPKLFINAEPGAILTGSARDYCRQWHNQQEVTVEGIHFIQEDSGVEIGAAISSWLSEI